MNLRRLVSSPTGRIIISVVLGIGLASLFYKVCKDKECIRFSGPVIQKVDGKIFEYDHKCYKYDVVPVTCNTDKQILPFTEGMTHGPHGHPTHAPTPTPAAPTPTAAF